MTQTFKDQLVFGSKVIAAFLACTEAASAGAAVMNIGSGPVLGGLLLASHEGLVAYGIWMANAALAILAGARSRPMLALSIGLVIFGLILATPTGWILAAVGAVALVLLLPMTMAGRGADAFETTVPVRYSRFRNGHAALAGASLGASDRPQVQGDLTRARGAGVRPAKVILDDRAARRAPGTPRPPAQPGAMGQVART